MFSRKKFPIVLIPALFVSVGALTWNIWIIPAKVWTSVVLERAHELYDPLALLEEPVPMGPAGEFPVGTKDLGARLKTAGIELLSLKMPEEVLPKGAARYFSYESAGNPRLSQLRESYELERFQTQPDFDGLVGLREWIHAQWEHGPTPNEPVHLGNFEADKILERAAAGDRFLCGEASYTYVQCAAAIGAQARAVTLEQREGRGHVVAEVWSNEWDSWVVMDPDQNVHYEHAGRPLSAMDLHEALLKDTPGLELRGSVPGSLDEPALRRKYLSLYYELAVRMRNDLYIRYPRWHPKGNVYVNTLEWMDEEVDGRICFAHETAERQDLYWPLNRTRVLVQAVAKSQSGLPELTISLQTYTPNFSHFAVELNGETRLLEEPQVHWFLEPGENRLGVASVNALGVRGVPSEIALRLPPQEL
ncbi:MAG: hypothetical protein JW937_01860 [Candidatus Omnitrophica bacterium]|nr:hypothetical protein [Candidatus Omnitrophota bacterium]